MKKIKVLAHPQFAPPPPPPPGCSLRLPDSWMLTRYLPRTGASARVETSVGEGMFPPSPRKRKQQNTQTFQERHRSLLPFPQQLRFFGGNPAAYFRLICCWRKKKNQNTASRNVSVCQVEANSWGEKTFAQTSVLDLGESWRGLKGQRARGAAVKEVFYSGKYF